MHYLRPIAFFLSEHWPVWLVCALILFGIRVWLIPKPADGERRSKDAGFLRGAVEAAMWIFGLMLFTSLAAYIALQFGVFST